MDAQANSERIRQLRADKGWSQEDLAEQAKMGLSTVQRAEGGRSVRARTLVDLASVLSVPVAAITATDCTANDHSTPASPGRDPRQLGRYGPLLAALNDAAKVVDQWRRCFADTLAYSSFFCRVPHQALFVQLQQQAQLAAEISLTLHRDVTEALSALARLDYQIQQAAVSVRSHAELGYGLSSDQQQAIWLGGSEECDNAAFHLKRSETELLAFLNAGL